MRHEKELLRYPWPECPEIEQKKVENPDKWSRIEHHRIRVQIAEIKGEKILGITVFNMGGGATHRFWQSENQMGMQVYHVRPKDYTHKHFPGKMYESCADSIFPRGWSCDRHVFYGLPEEEKQALEFLNAEGGILEALSRKQQAIRNDRTEKKHEKERAEIRKWFEGVEDQGEEFKQWCTDHPLKRHRYFFFEASGKKLRSGICSHCGKASELPNVKEYGKGICSGCGSEVTFRSAKKLENSCGFWHSCRVVTQEKHGEILLARGYTVGIRFSASEGVPHRQLWHSENERVYYNEAGVAIKRFDKSPGTYAVKVDGFHAAGTDGNDAALIAPMGIRELRESKGIRAELEILAERGDLYGYISDIFREAQRRPEMEYLIKNRLYALAASELDTGRGKVRALLKGQDKNGIIGLPGQEIDKLRRANADGRALMLIRELYKCGWILKSEDMADIHRMRLGYDSAPALVRMAEFSTMRKALNYTAKQAKKLKRSAAGALQHWEDYLKMADKAGWNTEDGVLFMPKDLGTAHNEAMASVKAIEDKKITAGVAKTGERLEALSWTCKGYLIRPARSQKELIAEGAALHHCVGKNGYDKKMAEGKTAIFFIRKADKPDVPLATLELKLDGGTVIQCYGANDRYPGDSIKKFYSRWAAEIVAPALKKKESKSA